MPLYEFICESCGHRFEEMKSISRRDEPEECPECGKVAERQISSAVLTGAASSGGTACLPSGGG